jgi:hypothetical protein
MNFLFDSAEMVETLWQQTESFEMQWIDTRAKMASTAGGNKKTLQI